MNRFFAARQAAAVLKHGILRRYLPVFVTKTGSSAGEVVYLDGYAGPGLYNDGSPGSPALALQTAQAVCGYRGRATLHGHLIEQDRNSVESLQELLADEDASWDVHHGRAEEYVPAILDDLEESTPLFAFIDPFGLPIPFEMVRSILRRGGTPSAYGRFKGAATELLLNFSIPGVNRVGGQLTGAGTDETWLKARDTLVARMDQVLGGDWWQAIWQRGRSNRVEEILEGYKEKLLEAGTGWAIFDVDVADRWKGPPSYHLLLMTQHPGGVAAFNECVSLAMEEYRQYCHEHEGLLDLDPLEDRDRRWISEIARNIESILAEGQPFRTIDRIMDVYGTAFGQARDKHLRAAIKQLHAAGKTPTNCVGVKSLLTLEIRPS